jgi:diaminohydroxyphosphoribosylaminopyrimidine deaminase / 5-amino-6-(5-phosphoribosylamino)uracil reductase
LNVDTAEGDHRVQPTIAGTVNDERYMSRAVAAAASVRAVTSPNPWVGSVLVTAAGTYQGATAPPGGPHAEVAALRLAEEGADSASGATLYTTLEPCAHHGRTPPCVEAIVAAGVARVVVGVLDPDVKVAGRGVARLEGAGVKVTVGVGAAAVSEQLGPYLKHRRTGRPWVVLKLAATLDGRTAASDGSSRWITGPDARRDVHRLRAESDAVLVGAGTVRTDDPELTVRDAPTGRQPLRVVLGSAPREARVQPALELSGDLGAALDRLGALDVVQLLVEGGATVAHELHAAGLVDRYVIYLAPALMGGSDGAPLFRGPGAATMADVWRGRVVSVRQLGEDLRVDLGPADEDSHPHVGSSPPEESRA